MIHNRKLASRIMALCLCLAVIFSALGLQVSAETMTPVAGTSAILVEPSTGTVLYEQNARQQIIPASTTKVLTALLVMEAVQRGQISLEDEITATQECIDGVIYDASKVVPNIVAGEVMTVRNYLYCVLLSSDCVACDILASYVSGSVEAFVALMNSRARELGCTGSSFLNTHGYPVEGHYSTAYDLYLICAEAIKYDDFNEIFGSIKYQLPATNMTTARMLYNTNWTLWNPEKIESIYCKYYYEYATGGKTGSSTASGHCLVSTAEKNGMTLVSVVTGAEIANPAEGEWWNMSFVESARMFEWGFDNYTHKTALRRGSSQATVNVKRSEVEEIVLVAAEEFSMTVPRGTEQLFSAEVTVYEETVKAPVSAGDVLGEVKISYNGEVVSTVSLIASKAAPVDRSVSPLLIIIIILIIIAAGVMLYVVNCDDPVILKQYKPYTTYRDKDKYRRAQAQAQQRRREEAASSRPRRD